MRETLRDIPDAGARGVFPPADGRTTVLPQACDRDAGVLAFTTARHLVGEPLWAQVVPGNARSRRAFQAAGYRTVSSEALLLARPGLSARARSTDCSRSRS